MVVGMAMMDQDSVILVILLLTTIFIAWYTFTQPTPDVHPLVLSSQSNVAQVRFPGSSPVYTNPLSTHRFVDGLQVQRKGSYHIHTGDLRDIWTLFNGKSFAVVGGGGGTTSSTDITRRIMALSCLIRVMESSDSTTICLDSHPLHLLIGVFACAFANKSACIVSAKKNPTVRTNSTLVITDDKTNSELSPLFVQDAKTVILVDSISSLSWDKATSYSESTPIPDLNESLSTPAIITFNSKNHPAHFTHQNITAAVACQLKLLTSIKYNVHAHAQALILQPLDDIYGLVMTFYFMARKIDEIVLSCNPESRNSLEVIKSVNPCALVAPTATLKAAASTTTPGSIISKYRMKQNLNQLAHGKLPSSPVVSNSKLNLIITRQAIGSGAHSIPLSMNEITHLRAYYACPLVYGLTASNQVAGPICQTNPWDYRDGVDHFGPPVPSIQAKLVDYNNYQGNLQLCGYTVCENKSPNDWIDIGLACKLGSDGCLEKVST